MGDKHGWVESGELIQVGRAWRMIAAPTPGHAVAGNAGAVAMGGPDMEMDEETKGLIDKLQQVDKSVLGTSPNQADVIRYNLARAAVLEQIVAKAQSPQQADQWVRQVADCYSTAAQQAGPSDDTAFKKLVSLK